MSRAQLPDLYLNTPEEARRVGWDRLPEHVTGPTVAQFVLHDYVAGTYTRMNMAGVMALDDRFKYLDRDGLTVYGGLPSCAHQWEELDEEPPRDCCVSCGGVKY